MPFTAQLVFGQTVVKLTRKDEYHAIEVKIGQGSMTIDFQLDERDREQLIRALEVLAP